MKQGHSDLEREKALFLCHMWIPAYNVYIMHLSDGVGLWAVELEGTERRIKVLRNGGGQQDT